MRAREFHALAVFAALLAAGKPACAVDPVQTRPVYPTGYPGGVYRTPVRPPVSPVGAPVAPSLRPIPADSFHAAPAAPTRALSPHPLMQPAVFAQGFFDKYNRGSAPPARAGGFVLGVNHDEPLTTELLRQFAQRHLRSGDTVRLESIDFGQTPEGTPSAQGSESHSYADIIRRYGPPNVRILGWDMPAARKEALRGQPAYPHMDAAPEGQEPHETDLTIYERDTYLRKAMGAGPGRVVVIAGNSHLWDPFVMQEARARGYAVYSFPTVNEAMHPEEMAEPLPVLRPNAHQVQIARGLSASYGLPAPAPQNPFAQKRISPECNPFARALFSGRATK